MTHTATTSRAVALAAGIALVGLVGFSATATAKPRKVFLNGEDLGDVIVHNHTFKHCIVRFDANGNVHITAPGLQIKTAPIRPSRGRVPVGKTVDRVAKYGRTFFLVSRLEQQGKLLPYRFTVHVNGKKIAVVDPKGAMAVHTITHLIQRGTNTVRITPQFRASSRVTRSPRDRLTIVLGAGNVKKGTVIIDNPVVSYRRDGSQSGQYTRVFRFTVK